MKGERSIPIHQDMIPALVLVLVFWAFCTALLFSVDTGRAVLYFAENRTPTLNFLAIYGTHLGEIFAYALVIVIFAFFDLRKSVFFALLGALGLIIVYLSKMAFMHPRPSLFFSNYSPELFNVEGWEVLRGKNGFPSGHTFGAFALATALLFFVRNQWLNILFSLIAIFVAWTRIYLVQHFVKDVFLGSLMGVGIAYLFFLMFSNFLAKGPLPLADALRFKKT